MANKPQQPETQFVRSDWATVPDVHRFSHQAMATTFEVMVQYEDRSYAQQAANAAFDEVDRIEGALSRYLETSDVVQINHLPAGKPVHVALDTFECLRISAEMYAQTGGHVRRHGGPARGLLAGRGQEAPDAVAGGIAVRPRAYGRGPDPARRADLRRGAAWPVPFASIWAGWARDTAWTGWPSLLKEWGIDRALIHGGFSSVLALDAPRGMKGWPVTLSHPKDRSRTLARLDVAHVSVSGSGVEKGQPHHRSPHRPAGRGQARNLVGGAGRRPRGCPLDSVHGDDAGRGGGLLPGVL